MVSYTARTIHEILASRLSRNGDAPVFFCVSPQVIKESETVQQTGAKRIMLTQAPAGIYKPPSDANDCQQGANDTFK
ncbi:unnamed protein product [Urochloa humidicola]